MFKYRFEMWGMWSDKRSLWVFYSFPLEPQALFQSQKVFLESFVETLPVFSQNVPDRTFRWPRKYQGGVCNAEHGQRQAFRLLMSTAFFQTMHWLSLVSVQPANSHRMDNYVNVEYVQRSHLASRLWFFRSPNTKLMMRTSLVVERRFRAYRWMLLFLFVAVIDV